MSFISCYGSQSFKAIPLHADNIITDTITFSDDSTLSNAVIDEIGVYYIDDDRDNFIPVPCSISNLSAGLIGPTIFPTSANFAFIVMPNWSFMLWTADDYGGNDSYLMKNSTDAPMCFYQSNPVNPEPAPLVEQNPYKNGTLITGSAGVSSWNHNFASSIQVFYNDIEHVIAGIT